MIHFILALLKFVNSLIPKSKYGIFFMPHPNCRKDLYDIINYRSDNTLTFLNQFIRTHELLPYICYVLAYNNLSPDIMNKYNAYLKENNIKTKIVFLSHWKDSSENKIFCYIKTYYFFSCSKYIFLSSLSYYSFPKVSQQIAVSLCYFTPFKQDYPSLMNIHRFVGQNQGNNIYIDYCISTSTLSAKIISADTHLDLYKFRILGFPRNDNLLRETAIDICKKLNINYIPSRKILYTPTFRDYESVGEPDERFIFGYDANEEISELLKKYNAVIFVKLHGLQNQQVVSSKMPEGMFVVPHNNEYGLYEVMQVSDALITDYTSAYFDFLLLNRPVLFNFYDKDYYERTRGFAYDPVESFCAGAVAYNKTQFLAELENILRGEDNYGEQRKKICSMYNKYSDDLSSQRIIDFFLDLSK